MGVPAGRPNYIFAKLHFSAQRFRCRRRRRRRRCRCCFMATSTANLNCAFRGRDLIFYTFVNSDFTRVNMAIISQEKLHRIVQMNTHFSLT